MMNNKYYTEMKVASLQDVNMSSFRGEVETTYDKLVEVFGLPQEGPYDRTLDKTTCEWRIRFEDGTVATIYDWKEDFTPMGLYNWHIGGFNDMARVKVIEALNN